MVHCERDRVSLTLDHEDQFSRTCMIFGVMSAFCRLDIPYMAYNFMAEIENFSRVLFVSHATSLLLSGCFCPLGLPLICGDIRRQCCIAS